MSEYHGMRWFKTDFQVQTPEDNRHWADDDLRLLSPRQTTLEEKVISSARQEPRTSPFSRRFGGSFLGAQRPCQQVEASDSPMAAYSCGFNRSTQQIG
ncbi:hypothetical protein ACFPU0_14415 [Pseudomonas sp. GCM10022186]|uniref:hypothetical protein n=1 Tax=Pseudomonas sp. GCM10022186 TaxID=3252650 RepID=UPI00360E9381